ncbi:MAG: nucleoside-diphosphate sugar epimerase/dehydratase [Anaerolineales bacterium]|jgi:FlaA1/EpsC-like NDP-sugar epimerase
MKLPRLAIRNRYFFLLDLGLITASVFLAFALRLELGPNFRAYLPVALLMAGQALLIKPLVFWAMGLYRRYWAYASVNEMVLIFTTVTLSSVILGVWIYIDVWLGWQTVPRSIPIIDWLVTLFLVGGVRLSVRLGSELEQGRRRIPGSALERRVLVVGAGDAGSLVVREMLRNPDLHLQPVGFLDDDPAKLHQRIHGVAVLGSIQELAAVSAEEVVDEVVIAMPSAPGEVFRRVTDACRLARLPFRTMPGIYELVGGRFSASRLRGVEVGDLLRREPAATSDQAVGLALGGRRVLVTGAGGSIGLELCRQVARWGPSDVVLLGHGENSIFDGLLDLGEAFPSLPLHPVIADIRDLGRVRAVFQKQRPQVVFHAAAHKHVPLMEANPEDALSNNVLGTRNLVEAALEADVERLVLISSDKAIHPASIMGATKRLAEMIVRDAAGRSGRPYVSVRFGNVLGSRGSVVPIFRHQINRGGPITITHPDMKRYFMTIPEAVHLVLQAASLGEGGEIFILKMGEPVRIVSLAEDLIRLSGLEPGKDIQIVFTGVRPGEKLGEQLWEDNTVLEPTSHPDILRLRDNHTLSGAEMQDRLRELADLVQRGKTDDMIELLNQTVGGTLGQLPPPEWTAL